MPIMTICLAALGYFVDILDLFLFNVLRIPSLKSLGLSAEAAFTEGVFIINCQMAGLILGSLLWGISGDRKGRLSILYGSILVYSAATLANAFVHSVHAYAACRFIAGFGLAGELGAAITLVSELMPPKKRGVGTTLIAGFGLSGGVAAALLAENVEWRSCYLIGGLMGLALLLLRFNLRESEIFLKAKSASGRGSLKLIFLSKASRAKYLQLWLVGIPIYFVSGILMLFAPELAKVLSIQGAPVAASQSILYSYLGVSLGDFLSGLLSQKLKSRKKAIAYFLGLAAITTGLYLGLKGISTFWFYVICFWAGVAAGYWAVLITTAAESFGTNVRATVTTTIPNFIRASLIPLTLLFKNLSAKWGMWPTAVGLAALTLVVAALCLRPLEETFGKNLAFEQ